MVRYPADPDDDFRHRAVDRPLDPAVLGHPEGALRRGVLRHTGPEGVVPGLHHDDMVPGHADGIINRPPVHRVGEGENNLLAGAHLSTERHSFGIGWYDFKDNVVRKKNERGRCRAGAEECENRQPSAHAAPEINNRAARGCPVVGWVLSTSGCPSLCRTWRRRDGTEWRRPWWPPRASVPFPWHGPRPARPGCRRGPW